MWERRYGLGVAEMWYNKQLDKMIYCVRHHDWDVIMNGKILTSFKEQQQAIDFIHQYIEEN